MSRRAGSDAGHSCCGLLLATAPSAVRRALEGTGEILGYRDGDARLTARAVPGGEEIVFRCPWSRGPARYHKHGLSFGHRVSHCPAVGGYYLINANTLTDDPAVNRLAQRSVMFLPALVPWVLHEAGTMRRGVYVAPSPQYGRDGVCRVNLKTGQWTDTLEPLFPGGRRGRWAGEDVISLIAYRDRSDYVAAAQTLVVILTDGAAEGMFVDDASECGQ